MNASDHNAAWEQRQAELWDRIFQVTQDVVALAETMDDSIGTAVLQEEMLGSAMHVGKHLVRANAANSAADFEKNIERARLQAIETDYWLRLAYIAQQADEVQRDLSSIISQYAGIIDLIQKLSRHVGSAQDSGSHRVGPKVNL